MERKKVTENTAVKIGTEASAVEAYRAAINDILDAPYVDQETKRVALQVLQEGCAVKSVSITNCQFDMGD